MYTKNPLTRDQVEGCLLGVAVGDALGMPYETMSSEDILAILGAGGVSGYPKSIPNGRSWTRMLTPGCTTDDWAMTSAIARAITRASGVPDRSVLIEEHIRAFDENPSGFGKSTKEAIERYRSGDHKPLPFFSANEARFQERSGNGVIMKIMPAVILGIKHPIEEMRLLILEMGRLTHRDIRSTALAYAVARFACDTFALKPGQHRELCEVYISSLTHATDAFIDETDGLDEPTREWAKCECSKSLMCALKPTRELPAGFTAMQTAPLVLSISSAVQETAMGIKLAISRGGDTDTHASIIGGILGLRLGIKSIPPKWIKGCKSASEVSQTTTALCDALGIK
jgi:ADP-ribosyl-[dinitrogen reductase] hydrolase